MKKINFTSVGNSILRVLRTAGHITVIASCLFVGFSAGEIYRAYKKGIEASELPQVQEISVTSVAINDRNELMIFDRYSGKYMLFSDSVGQAIFNQYASKIYLKRQSGAAETKP